MSRDQDPIIRYGAMFVVGLAYRGTANNGTGRLHNLNSCLLDAASSITVSPCSGSLPCEDMKPSQNE